MSKINIRNLKLFHTLSTTMFDEVCCNVNVLCLSTGCPRTQCKVSVMSCGSFCRTLLDHLSIDFYPHFNF